MNSKKALGNASSILKASASRWWASDPATLGAALSFYAIFSLTPLLLFAVVIIGRFLPANVVENQIVSQIYVYAGRSVAAVVGSVFTAAQQQRGGITAGIFGFAVALFGCLGLFVQLEHSLDRVWGILEPSGFIAFVQKKLLAILAVLGLGLIFVLSIVATALLAGFQGILPKTLGAFLYLVPVGQVVAIVAGFLGLVFAYRYLPRRKVSWESILLGSLVTSVLFVIGGGALKLYLDYVSVSSSYGAAGTLAVLLVWMYYSSQIFFFGAALTYSIDESKKSKQQHRA
jgi:membrane protein